MHISEHRNWFILYQVSDSFPFRFQNWNWFSIPNTKNETHGSVVCLNPIKWAMLGDTGDCTSVEFYININIYISEFDFWFYPSGIDWIVKCGFYMMTKGWPGDINQTHRSVQSQVGLHSDDGLKRQTFIFLLYNMHRWIIHNTTGNIFKDNI